MSMNRERHVNAFRDYYAHLVADELENQRLMDLLVGNRAHKNITLLTPDGARPIVMWNRAAICMQPYVKGYVPQVNSVYNGFRFEDVWMDK